MRCPNCQTLNPAQAKFCLECGNRLLICPNCGTANLPYAKFCMECGTRLQPIAAAPAATGATTAPMPIITSTTRTEPQALLLPPEERRVVTIMFADIIDSTRLGDRLDPEELRAILTGYFNLIAEQVRKHEGTIEKYIGDAVMVIFGAPIAHEDDPDRAIRTALDIQDALQHFNEQRLALDPNARSLQIRIGINTGEVAIPSTTTHQRQDFLVTGDAVNVASRLQTAAAPDTILVGERTYLTTRDVFRFRPIAPLHLKGKPEPINAYAVEGVIDQAALEITQHPRGIPGKQVRMVGRALELTLLHANYARVLAERHPHLITILGSPGIGKSRLVREFIAREQEKVKTASSQGLPISPLVLEGRCPPYGEEITYRPLIEIMRGLLKAKENEDIQSLKARFCDFVQDIFTRTYRKEPTEEIVDTIFRSLGRGREHLQTVSSREKSKSELSSVHSTKQSGVQSTLSRAWRTFLEALAELQPLIIVVDDLQWADEALLELLEYLTDRITDVPILFLCPARPDLFERRPDWGGGRRNFTTIELESLSKDETNELIDAHLNNRELPEVLRTSILSRAEGNPFFVEEIIRMLIDQHILIHEQNGQQNTESWHIGNIHDPLLGELPTLGEQPEDALISTHYVLPLPHIPDTIQGVLVARVDLLNPIEKLVLQHAAVIGRTFWLAALRELAPEISINAILEALDSLTERDFILETERPSRNPIKDDRFFTFKHVLIRDVVYNNIPRARRSREHALLALWLEAQVKDTPALYAELLAYHYQQALANWSLNLSLEQQQGTETRISRPELRRRAIKYLIIAGDQALHSYYTLRALQAYHDAFDLLTEEQIKDTHLQIKLHIKLGDAYSQRGDTDQAWQDYRKAEQLALSQEEKNNTLLLEIYEDLAELGTRWSNTFRKPPTPSEVKAYIDAGIELLGQDTKLSPERVAFHTYLAFWYIRQLESASYAQKASLAEQALTSGHEALQMAERLNDPQALSLTLDSLSFINIQYHKYKEAYELQMRRQKLESKLTDREELYDLYYSLGFINEQLDDYPTALMWFGRAWNNAQTMESPSSLLASMSGRMRVWRQWNRWDEAQQVAEEILQLLEQYQHKDEKRRFWALETLATIAFRRGQLEEGEQYYRQCRRLIDQEAQQLGEDIQQHLVRLHAIHLAQGDWQKATEDYRAKLQNSEPLPSPEVLSTLADLLVTTQAPFAEQERICERALQVAESSGSRKSMAIAIRARGRMYMEQKRWKLAENDLREALHRCEVLDLPWEQANTLYALGVLYKRLAAKEEKTNRRSAYLARSRYHFEQAIGFFESLKAQPGVERTRQAMLQDILTF